MSSAPEHQRDHEVREPCEGRDDEQEDHQCGVHRDQAVVLLAGEELQPGLGELGAERLRAEPANQEEDERRDQVLDPDHLVVGVDLEVVLPAIGAVVVVVLGLRRRADHVAEPVVEAADAEDEADRHQEQHRREGDRPRVPVPAEQVADAPPAERCRCPPPPTSRAGRATSPGGSRRSAAGPWGRRLRVMLVVLRRVR